MFVIGFNVKKASFHWRVLTQEYETNGFCCYSFQWQMSVIKIKTGKIDHCYKYLIADILVTLFLAGLLPAFDFSWVPCKAGHEGVQRLWIFVSGPSQALLPSCYTDKPLWLHYSTGFHLLPSYILCFLRSCRLLIFHSPLLPHNVFDKHNAAAKAATELNDAICQLPPSAMKPTGV